MSSGSLLSSDESLHFDVVSPEEVRKRARLPQSSSLSSSLARGLSRTTSLPSSASTPTSALSESRTCFIENLDSRLTQESIPEEDESTATESEDLKALSHSRPILQRPRKLKKHLAAGDLAGSLDEDDFVPPHMMSLPAYAGRTDEALQPGSLFEGVGRKLRGIDAVRFRRSVMQQTGFLESAGRTIVR